MVPDNKNLVGKTKILLWENWEGSEIEVVRKNLIDKVYKIKSKNQNLTGRREFIN